MGKPSDSDSGSVSTEGDKAPYDLPGKVSTEGDVPAASTPSTTQLTTAAPKSFGQMVGTIAQKAGIGLLDVLRSISSTPTCAFIFVPGKLNGAVWTNTSV